MRMTAIEKHFINESSHTKAVAAQALQLLDRISPERGWCYLDVGCGVGAAAHEIVQAYDLHVTGVDVDPKQIQIAQRTNIHQNLKYKVMNAAHLEFDDGQFNIVASQMVTHHIHDWEAVFSEMIRVLKPGGYLIYRDFVFSSWLARTAEHIIWFTGFPSLNKLNSLASLAGLTTIHQSYASGKISLIWQRCTE